MRKEFPESFPKMLSDYYRGLNAFIPVCQYKFYIIFIFLLLIVYAKHKWKQTNKHMLLCDHYCAKRVLHGCNN